MVLLLLLRSGTIHKLPFSQIVPSSRCRRSWAPSMPGIVTVLRRQAQGEREGHRWRRRIKSGTGEVDHRPRRGGAGDRRLRLPVICLAPDLVAAILDGRQPNGAEADLVFRKVDVRPGSSQLRSWCIAGLAAVMALMKARLTGTGNRWRSAFP